MERDRSAIIVGGGVSGLAAASALIAGGWSVTLLEARPRLGGRILTLRDSKLGFPIELGAEFVHGRAPEVFTPLQANHAPIIEVEGRNWCVSQHQLRSCDFFSSIDLILEKMDETRPDESFRTFLDRTFPESDHNREARRRALAYVTGFNAADPDVIGVHWLVESMRAEEKIEGHRSFRAQNGYQTLVEIFRRNIESSTNSSIHLQTVVEEIWWKQGHVELYASTPSGATVFTAPKTLVTLPLALLKLEPGEPGPIRFIPPLPREKVESLDKIEVGHIIRVVLRFKDRFWAQISPPGGSQNLHTMGFLFSEDESFPTWWTAMPENFPILTGWSPFRSADRLSTHPEDFIVRQSLRTLSSLLGVDYRKVEENLEHPYLHNWQTDPFSRGAYSYGKFGGEGAQQGLGAPVENTLFFAGEATDTSGNNGTVHGAIASGYRAVQEIMQTSR